MPLAGLFGFCAVKAGGARACRGSAFGGAGLRARICVRARVLGAAPHGTRYQFVCSSAGRRSPEAQTKGPRTGTRRPRRRKPTGAAPWRPPRYCEQPRVQAVSRSKKKRASGTPANTYMYTYHYGTGRGPLWGL